MSEFGELMNEIRLILIHDFTMLKDSNHSILPGHVR